MSVTVTVLCGRGRRVTLHVSPHTTLQEVLEEVCERQHVSAECHCLLHHNRRVDLNNSMRLSGLPNRAQLEMQELDELTTPLTSDTAMCAPVKLAVQLDDGSRKMGEFAVSASLWQVLEELSLTRHAEDGDATLVCVFAGRQMTGDEELRAMSLRRLGLSAGSRAVVRLLVRRDLPTPGLQAHVGGSLMRRQEGVIDDESSTNAVQNESRSVDTGRQLKTSPDSAAERPHVIAVDPDEPCTSDSRATVLPIDNHVEDEPQQRPDRHAQVSASTDIYDTDACRLTAPQAGPSSHELIGTTGGEAMVDFIDTDYRSVVFSMDETRCASAHPPLPDDFFEVTIEDVRSRHHSLQQQAAATTEGNPLMTSFSRGRLLHSQQLQVLSVYRQCVVRVAFNVQRKVLQLVLPSAGSVVDLLRATARHLSSEWSDAGAETDLSVYVAEPMLRKLECQQSLLEAGCVPTARVLARDSRGQEPLLAEDVNDKVSSVQAADQILDGVKRKPPAKHRTQVEPPATDSRSNCGAVASKIPSWFTK